MDMTTLQTAGMATTFTIIAGILYKVYHAVNGKRCHSRCCDKDFDMEMEIGEIPHQQNPLHSVKTDA